MLCQWRFSVNLKLAQDDTGSSVKRSELHHSTNFLYCYKWLWPMFIEHFGNWKGKLIIAQNRKQLFMLNERGRGKLATSKGIESTLMLGVRFRISTVVVVSCDLSMCNCVCVCAISMS